MDYPGNGTIKRKSFDPVFRFSLHFPSRFFTFDEYISTVETEMESVTSDKLNQAVFRILALLQGDKETQSLFPRVHEILRELLGAASESSPSAATNIPELLTRIDHDLRSPIFGILGFSEILLEDITDPEARKKAELILISAQRLIQVMDGIMDQYLTAPDRRDGALAKNGTLVPTGEADLVTPGEPPGSFPAAKSPKPRKSGGKKLPEVLIVEDNMVNIQLLMIYIRRYCNIFSTQNATSALALTKKRKFDAILMDINLGPGMDGIQVMHEIRKQPRNENTPIIAVTGYACFGDRESFMKAGFTEFIRKPVDRHEIKKVLQGIFAGSRKEGS